MRQVSPRVSPRNSLDEATLHEHVFKNDVESARQCIANDAMAWNQKDVNGMTPLMLAATLNRSEILQILINSRCDVNVTDEFGNTALHLAVDEGNTETVVRLVRSGRCIMDATNVNGETALMRAAFYDYSDLTKVILKDGAANPDTRNKVGQTALLIALQEGSHVTADLLLKHGCDVMIADDLGRSALYMAIHSPCIKNLETARALVASGYDINVDRIWLLNEEKHNLFYQDDDFYAELRRKLRSNSYSNNNNTTLNRNQRKVSSQESMTSSSMRTSPSSSPNQMTSFSPPFAMSPTVKEKIMSSEAQKFTPIPFSKTSTEAIRLKPVSASTLYSKRNAYKDSSRYPSMASTQSTSTHYVSNSLDSDDSPIHSPTTRDHMTSHVGIMTSESDEDIIRSRVSVSDRSVNSGQVAKRQNMFTSPNMRRSMFKSSNDNNKATEVTPVIKYKRQISAQPVRTGPQATVYQRKISLPNKPVVQFSTEIQIFEIAR